MRASAKSSNGRDRNHEVDIVHAGKTVTAIAVKSGRSHDTFPGLSALAAAVPKARKLLVSGDDVRVEEFLGQPVLHWMT